MKYLFKVLFTSSNAIFVVGFVNSYVEGREAIGMIMICTAILMDRIDSAKK